MKISERDKKAIESFTGDKFENFRGFICRREDIEANPFQDLPKSKKLTDKERLKQISKSQSAFQESRITE